MSKNFSLKLNVWDIRQLKRTAYGGGGTWDGSADKGTWPWAWQPKCEPTAPYSIRREQLW